MGAERSKIAARPFPRAWIVKDAESLADIRNIPRLRPEEFIAVRAPIPELQVENWKFSDFVEHAKAALEGDKLLRQLEDVMSRAGRPLVGQEEFWRLYYCHVYRVVTGQVGSLSATSSSKTRNYSILVPDETWIKAARYLKELKAARQCPGARVQRHLKSDLRKIDLFDLLDALLQSKELKTFSGSGIKGDGTDWNVFELRLLGDISMAVPVTIFYYGHNAGSSPKNAGHRRTLSGTLLHTCGALLQPSQTAADWEEVISDNIEMEEASYLKLIERRLLPCFRYANRMARCAGKKAFVAIPSLGYRAFSGRFQSQAAQIFEFALQRLLQLHGSSWQNISTVYHDPSEGAKTRRETINGITYIVRSSGSSQLPSPDDFEGDDHSACEFFGVVDADHAAWPGNEFWEGSCETDDGIKAASTDLMFKMTGVEGHFDFNICQYLPPSSSQTWGDVLRQRGVNLDTSTLSFRNIARWSFSPLATQEADANIAVVKAIVFPDPCLHGQNCRILAFYHADHDEVWDTLCDASFLSNFYDVKPEVLKIKAPKFGNTYCFRNCEAAFQALQFAPRAQEFQLLNGTQAVQLRDKLEGQENYDYAGYSSPWKGMWHILRVKFAVGTPMADRLTSTGGAFLLHHSPFKGSDGQWSDDYDGSGMNWLGLQLMVLRDDLLETAGLRATEWSKFISACVDLETGASRIANGHESWPAVVCNATHALLCAMNSLEGKLDNAEYDVASPISRQDEQCSESILAPSTFGRSSYN